MKTLGQIAYEAAAVANGCTQPWAEATQEKWEAAAKAVANECAKIADSKAMHCEADVLVAEDEDEVTSLRSLAWQFSVLAEKIRKRAQH